MIASTKVLVGIGLWHHGVILTKTYIFRDWVGTIISSLVTLTPTRADPTYWRFHSRVHGRLVRVLR